MGCASWCWRSTLCILAATCEKDRHWETFFFFVVVCGVVYLFIQTSHHLWKNCEPTYIWGRILNTGVLLLYFVFILNRKLIDLPNCSQTYWHPEHEPYGLRIKPLVWFVGDRNVNEKALSTHYISYSCTSFFHYLMIFMQLVILYQLLLLLLLFFFLILLFLLLLLLLEWCWVIVAAYAIQSITFWSWKCILTSRPPRVWEMESDVMCGCIMTTDHWNVMLSSCNKPVFVDPSSGVGAVSRSVEQVVSLLQKI